MAVRESDVIPYFWASPGSETGGGGPAFVQNQSLNFNFYGATAGNPSTPYPFTRLAWLNSTTAGATYIYHQLSDSVLAEDAFYVTAGWHTTNITVGSLD